MEAERRAVAGAWGREVGATPQQCKVAVMQDGFDELVYSLVTIVDNTGIR